jgi:hypothetical protein
LKGFSNARIASDEVLLLPTISLDDIINGAKEGIKGDVIQDDSQTNLDDDGSLHITAKHENLHEETVR